MDKKVEDALKVLKSVSALVQGTLKDHQVIQESLKIIEQELSKQSQQNG